LTPRLFARDITSVRSSNGVTLWIVIVLLSIHAGLLAYAAPRHSPTMLEPPSLVAGLSHWEFGRFELFRVNPPLVRMVAALPVRIAGYNEDWSMFHDSPGARPEFQIGADFIKANGERSIWLFTIARWACLPFSLMGGLFCFFWSRELWHSNLAGLISLFLWTFEPNILAHGELITSDCGAASIGLGACYLFWRWLRSPLWSRAAYAGLFLGLAELTKTSWLILFILWPMLGLFWLLTDSRNRSRKWLSGGIRSSTSILQCLFILAFGLYVLNLGYGFDGSLTKLKEFTFISKTLTGLPKAGEPGNRLFDSWLGELPIPVPRQYLRGIDLQKKDLEDYHQLSYLRGEWKQGGWWYYYLYGLAVKTPHGTQLLILGAFLTVVALRSRKRPTLLTCDVHPRDLFVLLAPALTILILVSSQLEFNQHLRYILPAFGFLFVLCGANSLWFRRAA
jgi:dolichyl-phosphate-mannose-protein mannosyltransferase